jgi:hypothetical protein
MLRVPQRPSLLPTLLAFTLGLSFLPPSRAADLDNILLLHPAPVASDSINASARGLAGEASGASWESNSDWRNYQGWLDRQWNYLERVRLHAMHAWGGSELGGLDSEVVFYPFSGPDVLYADTLFPTSKVILMAGLEPVGTMPDFAQLEENGKLGAYLKGVRTSLSTILVASFFKTKDMKTDFNNQLVDGLMPAMAVFLARQGYTIEGIRYITLDHDGVLHPRGEKSGAPGVQITFGGGRTVLYFQTDLGNDGLKDNPGYIRLMERLKPGVTYLKAASYLLYDDYFSTIRDSILDESSAVVEDDSGVPFRYFKPSVWDVEPYGNYTGPIALFKEHYQPDLTAYYAQTPHSPLSFGSGYKFVSSMSSLLVAKKK